MLRGERAGRWSGLPLGPREPQKEGGVPGRGRAGQPREAAAACWAGAAGAAGWRMGPARPSGTLERKHRAVLREVGRRSRTQRHHSHRTPLGHLLQHAGSNASRWALSPGAATRSQGDGWESSEVQAAAGGGCAPAAQGCSWDEPRTRSTHQGLERAPSVLYIEPKFPGSPAKYGRWS